MSLKLKHTCKMFIYLTTGIVVQYYFNDDVPSTGAI